MKVRSITYSFSLLLLFNSVILCKANKPNILLFFVDDMGYGDLSCVQDSEIKTQHIDSTTALITVVVTS